MEYLDSITTHPTGSRSQRVDINLAYDVDGEEPDKGEVLKAFLVTSHERHSVRQS